MTDLHAPEQSTLRVQGLPTAENRWQVQCLNCNAPVTGAFCSSCGQRAVPPHPTLREVGGDAFAELSGWDGKFAETFRTLLRKPGELSRQWIEGRRVSFISPIRLYLTTSLVYFVVTASAPNPVKGGADRFNLELTETGPTSQGSAQAKKVTDEVNRAIATKQALTGAERDSALAQIAKAPAVFRPIFRRAIEDPGSLQTSVRKVMPNVFLALVPVFALVLALFYRRRHYPEHLFFAIHLAAFVFLARTVSNLALFVPNLWFIGAVQIIVGIWIIAYGVLALRRVYGGSVPMTIAKGIGICALYALIATPIVAGVAFWAVST